MPEKIFADASPEKRLFISLVTRDISLVDAFLDLIDNSINAALEPMADDLKSADDYQRIAASKKKAKVRIDVNFSGTRIIVKDNAAGISSTTARDHVFKFGRDSEEANSSDRLSVYGIGLKRAMFKCGDKINIVSDHKAGGFELKLDVPEWASPIHKNEPWRFPISERQPEKLNCGTTITILNLHDDVTRRINDGLFEDQLKERVSRTYAFFIGRIVDIYVNNQPIEAELLEVSMNHATERFKNGSVTCNVTAGIAATNGEHYRDKNAGWYVFCNGRAVVFADKTTLTGWGVNLPIFQPKHRPFLGIVHFFSTNAEDLPWTTTKGTINADNITWQIAKREMTKVGRVVIGFLDKRYTEDGTEVTSSELQNVSGGSVSVLKAATQTARTFKTPKKSDAPKEIKIQYQAKITDVEKIETYLRKPNLGGSEVGRFTFNYFLKNEVNSK